MTFAPHTTQVFQVLGVTLFSVLKRRPSDELLFGDDTATVKLIRKLYFNFRQRTVHPSIWGDFRALGVEYDFDARSESSRP
jgi:hypothetical protein